MNTSMTLNLVDRLLALGRKFQALGRNQDARHVLGKLAAFGELPAEVAEETQARLADICLKKRKLRRARRHLSAALLHCPGNARYHYLLATALDPRQPEEAGRAIEHYRKSLDLDPNQPVCLGKLGLLALRLERTEEGLAALRRAVELAPDDPEVVGNLVEGLRREGLLDEARTALRAALFRNPRDGHFQRLKSDFEFHQLRQQQQASLRRRRATREEGPVVLPFIRLAPGTMGQETDRKIIRHDGPSLPARPHFPRPQRRSGQRHAQ